MWKKIPVVSAVAAILLAGAATATAQNPKRPNNSGQPPAATQGQTGSQQNAQANGQRQQGERTYLGVTFEPVPKAIVSQLSTAFPQLARGEGVLITRVMPNSPAAKAGIKPYDLVTEVNNSPVNAIDALMKIVAREKPGQQIALHVVRNAKAENLNVTLGERPVVRGQEPEAAEDTEAAENAGNREGNEESAANVDAELETFDSMSLERTGKDQYKAEIKFRDKQGKIDTRTFQGTRAEIRKDVMAQKDLPRSERRQLLGSLRLPMELTLLPGAAPRQNERQENGSQQNGTR